MTGTGAGEIYREGPGGIYARAGAQSHRSEDYEEGGFDLLVEMQERHFWYRGRHRFLLHALKRGLAGGAPPRPWRVIDLGGGCGGWIGYLKARLPGPFAELALADSSQRALTFAEGVVGAAANRYQIDLYDLGWRERWEAVFLLDVLEHLDDDAGALKQVREALVPGGWAFITTPAFPRFWSYNDDLVHHKRRYKKCDYRRLARECGFEVVRLRYFMFFLSPLLVLSRLGSRRIEDMSEEEVRVHLAHTHRVPARPLNRLLTWVFGAETPLGWWLPFPWGTSILAVLRRPRA